MNSLTTVLAIETSCDECSIALVRAVSSDKGTASTTKTGDFAYRLEILSLETFSQIELHRPFGGIVPEVASRNHLETLPWVLEKALNSAKILIDEVDLFAVTNRPGLVGALLVGVTAAKSFAYALKKPLVAVHHLEGHVCSLYLNANSTPELPCMLAIVSGGHTQLHLLTKHPWEWDQDFYTKSRLGRSLDDAAGEAFDKAAKMMGLPYPGGVMIDQLSQNGNKYAYRLPQALKDKTNFDFSFSGLKTAFSLFVKKEQTEPTFTSKLPDLCASLQEAIVDQLTSKLLNAAKTHACKSIAVVGGVASNSRLRERLTQEWPNGFYCPPKELCSDNAAMIGAAGFYQYINRGPLPEQEILELNAVAYPDAAS